MKKSDSIQKLAEALAAAQGEMPVVPFDSSNPFYKSSYASLGSVISASRPVLAKHGLSICQMPVSNENKVGIETTLMHTSGEWMSETLLVPLVDEKGNSLIQTVGKDLTYLRRYAWSSFCGLYADEDTDGNGPAPQPQRQQSTPVTKPTPPAKPPRTIPKRDAPIATAATREWMVDQLAAEKIHEQAFAYFVSKGMLLETESLDMLPLEFVPTSKVLMAEMITLIKAKAKADDDQIPGVEVQEPEQQEPEMPEGNGEAWREYPLPYNGQGGKVPKGTPLGKLEKNYLYGLFKNVKVATEFNGKPLSEQQIQANKDYRAALDAAGAHYEFK